MYPDEQIFKSTVNPLISYTNRILDLSTKKKLQQKKKMEKKKRRRRGGGEDKVFPKKR